MSRRESNLKATAGALQPKNLDLTQYRQQSLRERRLKVRSEDAAAALAFASMDMEIDGEHFVGDKLSPLLLRMKYADQVNRESFKRAHELLYHHHGGRNNKRSVVIWALALIALFEWLYDPCPKCRVGKKRKGGVRCVSCGSSGRTAFTGKQRFRFVNDYLRDAQRAGHGAQPLGLDNFIGHWLPRYLYLLDALRAADRNLGIGLDFGIFPSKIRRTVPDPHDPSSGGVVDQEEDEPERAEDSPRTGQQEPTGELPPTFRE